MTKKRSPGEIERMRKDTPNVTRQLNRIYERDGGICQLCGLPCSREDASRDHIKELRLCTKEEARSDDNVVLAHKKCNEERSAALRMAELVEERLEKLRNKYLRVELNRLS